MHTYHYMTWHYITLHYITYNIYIYIYIHVYIFTSLSIEFCLWGWAHGLQASPSICYHQKLAIASMNKSADHVLLRANHGHHWGRSKTAQHIPTCNLHSFLFLRHVCTCSCFWIVSCSQEVAERRAGGEVQGQGLQSEAEWLASWAVGKAQGVVLRLFWAWHRAAADFIVRATIWRWQPRGSKEIKRICKDSKGLKRACMILYACKC